MIKESLKQKPKNLLHVFLPSFRMRRQYFSVAISFVLVVIVVVVIVQGVINVVWVYFCLDHLLGYFSITRREKAENSLFMNNRRL